MAVSPPALDDGEADAVVPDDLEGDREDHVLAEHEPAKAGDEIAEADDESAKAEAVSSVRQLLALGKLAQARFLCAADAPHLTGLLALIDAVDAGEAVLRELGFETIDAAGATPPGIMLAPRKGHRQLLVVFGSDDGRFVLPRALEQNAPHLLFVSDPRQCLAMLGVRRLGPDYDACLTSVLRIARRLGAEHVFCLGAGAAAYSALRFGLDLGAEGVLALGTLTRLDAGTRLPGLGSARLVARLLRIAAELGPDLELAYARAAQRPGLVLCRPHAAAMTALATLDGVTVIEASPDMPDDPLGWAEETDRLPGLLRDVLACKAVG